MKVITAKDAMLGEKPGYRKLVETCPVLSTWDDHPLRTVPGLTEQGCAAGGNQKLLERRGAWRS